MSSYYTAGVTEADGENHNPLLEDIRKCTDCALNPCAGNNIYPCPGYFFSEPPLDILFIGMSPGKDENKLGRPFVGKAGRKLMSLVYQVWPDKKPSMGLTNVCRCHTPENRAPKPLEIAACSHWLMQELIAAKPKVVFLLGNSAIPLAFPGKRIGQVAGQARRWTGRTAIACYHPAAVLHKHDPGIEASIIGSLKLGKELLK